MMSGKDCEPLAGVEFGHEAVRARESARDPGSPDGARLRGARARQLPSPSQNARRSSGSGASMESGAAGHRMRERQPRSVEGVTRKLEHREVVLGQLAVGSSGETRLVGAVELVADDQGAEGGEVHADLVLTAGLELATDERIRSAVRRGACPLDEEARRGGERIRRLAEAHLHAVTAFKIELERALEAKRAGAVGGRSHHRLELRRA